MNTFSMFANILGTVTFNAWNDLYADNSLLGKVSLSMYYMTIHWFVLFFLRRECNALFQNCFKFQLGKKVVNCSDFERKERALKTVLE